MNILFYQWNAYNQKDVINELQRLGCNISFLTNPITNPEEDWDYVTSLISMIRDNHFDFLFSINYFPVLAQACHECGLLYVCWTCDSPLLAMYHDSIFFSTNVVFTFDKSNQQEWKQHGVSHIFHLPLACNPERMQKQIKYNDVFSYPVSFIGSLYENNSFDPIVDQLPPYLLGYLEGIMNAQLLVSGGNLLEQLLTEDICLALEDYVNYHKSEHSFASIKTLFANTVLGFKTASLERIQNLSALSLFLAKKDRVHLFTYPTKEMLPLVTIHPPVDYLTEMPQIFGKSAINLNMTIPNIHTGIPLRIWDILGCGGFLLTNYQTELEEHFSIGTHLDIFEDTDELKAKTAFYLKQDTLRKKIARNGYELVCEKHTYTQRLTHLLSVVKSRL